MYSAITLKPQSGGLRNRIISNEIFVYDFTNTQVILTHGIKVDGLWDTGATHSVISHKAATLLNLSPIGKGETTDANETRRVDLYAITIIMHKQIRVNIASVSSANLSGFDFNNRYGHHKFRRPKYYK